MKLNSISLTNYKNLNAEKLDFDDKINCLIGNNGVGKSNILDAIYHLCFGKGYFNSNTSQNIKFKKDFFIIEGIFNKKNKVQKIHCSAKRGGKKIIKRNNKSYDKISDHIGFLPLVIISPSDRDLISEGSSVRRKFIDGIISQTNNQYLNTLLKYNKVLIQRNALLKHFLINRTYDQDVLLVYNDQLELLGTPIHEERKKFIDVFSPIFERQYKGFCSSNEIVSLEYESSLNNHNFSNLLLNNLEKDRRSQYTNVGIHKDDLLFKIHGESINKFGSQGQQKSFLIALKLAQFDFIKKKSSVSPIILLDDVFDKLDQKRVELIMQLVEKNHFGQIFISDTHYDRSIAAIKTTQLSYKIFNLH
tara:strand:- start:1919 stop:3001 length:1083 start_codon:yes stop_codon:yes gene_type:complete